jgi:hypothetical protein
MSSGAMTLNLADQAFQNVRSKLPPDQAAAWDTLAKGQPLNVLVRLARLWRVEIT